MRQNLFPFRLNRVTDRSAAFDAQRRLLASRKQLGSGACGVVFEWDSNRVVKIGRSSDWGYITWLEMINRQSRPNPYLPRIHGAEVWMDKAGEFAFRVTMERLDSISSVPKNDRFYDEYRIIKDIVGNVYTGPINATTRKLSDVADLIRRAHLSSTASLDMHNGNAMVRNHSQLVITDPLY